LAEYKKLDDEEDGADKLDNTAILKNPNGGRLLRSNLAENSQKDPNPLIEDASINPPQSELDDHNYDPHFLLHIDNPDKQANQSDENQTIVYESTEPLDDGESNDGEFVLKESSPSNKFSLSISNTRTRRQGDGGFSLILEKYQKLSQLSELLTEENIEKLEKFYRKPIDYAAKRAFDRGDLQDKESFKRYIETGEIGETHKIVKKKIGKKKGK